MFASAVQMSSPDRSSAFVSVIVGWVRYFCLKIPSSPLGYFWFLGSKLYGTDSVPIMYLSSSLCWCDFHTFFVRWAWRTSQSHNWAGKTGGHRNHVANTYLQRLIFSAPPLIFVSGLVGVLRGEGSDIIISRERFYLFCPILIQSSLWKLRFLFQQYSVCVHGVARVGISYHSFLLTLWIPLSTRYPEDAILVVCLFFQSINQLLVRSHHLAYCSVSCWFA